MKKILSLVLAASMMLFAVGCGTSNVAEQQPEEEVIEENFTTVEKSDETLIGVAMPTQSLQRWNQDGANMKAQLEEKGYKVDLQYANNDVNTQVQQLENMITKGCNLLVVASIDGSALTDVLGKAKENGIPVIAYDRLIMQTDAIDYYATFDNYKVGVTQGEYIVESLDLENQDGPFNIELFTGAPDDNNCVFFFGGAMSILQPYIDEGKLVVPSGQTEFAAVATQGWDSAKAQQRMDNLITANYANGTKLDAILSSNDSVAIGIVASLQNAGYGDDDKPYPILTGQDCDKANVIAMLNEQQSMSVFKDTRTLAVKVVEMVDAIMNGEDADVNDTETYDNGVKVIPSFLCDPVIVTLDNYEEMLIESGYYSAEDIEQ